MRRVLLLPTLLLAGLAVVAVAAIAVFSRTTTRAVERRVREVRRANALGFRIAYLTVEEERAVLAYRIDRLPGSLRRIAASQDETEAIAREIGGIEVSARGRRLWTDVLKALALRSNERRALISAVDGGRPEVIDLAYARWDLAAGRASDAATDLSVYNVQTLERSLAELQHLGSRSVLLLGGVLAGSALLVMAFSLLINRHVVRPVCEMTEAARRIGSAREDFSVPGAERDDELGILARVMTRTAGELVRANSELGRSVAARDEFLSIASHELKSPLTALKLQLQGALRRWRGEAIPQWLQGSLRQVDRIESLVAELLDLARIRAGRLTLRPQKIELGELARAVAERLRDVLAHSGNTLEVDVADRIAGDFDGPRLEQVLANLLVNAAKHAPGSHVRLRARREGEKVVLTVEDDGPGIPADALERVFLPYEKLDGNLGESGLGLGLFIVRQIVEGHAGRIQASAGMAGGAAFTIELPASSASEPGSFGSPSRG